MIKKHTIRYIVSLCTVNCTLPPHIAKAIEVKTECFVKLIPQKPGQNQIEEEIIKQINSAADSIYILCYRLSAKRIANALKDAADRGVRIFIFADHVSKNEEWEAWKQLKDDANFIANFYAKGICIKKLPFNHSHCLNTYVHSKAIIIDENRCLTGSYNFVCDDNIYPFDISILIFSKEIAKQYIRHYNALLEELNYEQRTIPLQSRQKYWRQVNPNLDDPNYKPVSECNLLAQRLNERTIHKGVIQSINLAKSTIFVANIQLRCFDFIDALQRAARRGITVFIITDSKKKFLKNLSKMNNTYCFTSDDERYLIFHAKVIIIDGSKTVIGSWNPSHYSDIREESAVFISDTQIAHDVLKSTLEFKTKYVGPKEKEGDAISIMEALANNKLLMCNFWRECKILSAPIFIKGYPSDLGMLPIAIQRLKSLQQAIHKKALLQNMPNIFRNLRLVLIPIPISRFFEGGASASIEHIERMQQMLTSQKTQKTQDSSEMTSVTPLCENLVAAKVCDYKSSIALRDLFENHKLPLAICQFLNGTLDFCKTAVGIKKFIKKFLLHNPEYLHIRTVQCSEGKAEFYILEEANNSMHKLSLSFDPSLNLLKISFTWNQNPKNILQGILWTMFSIDINPIYFSPGKKKDLLLKLIQDLWDKRFMEWLLGNGKMKPTGDKSGSKDMSQRELWHALIFDEDKKNSVEIRKIELYKTHAIPKLILINSGR